MLGNRVQSRKSNGNAFNGCGLFNLRGCCLAVRLGAVCTRKGAPSSCFRLESVVSVFPSFLRFPGSPFSPFVTYPPSAYGERNDPRNLLPSSCAHLSIHSPHPPALRSLPPPFPPSPSLFVLYPSLFARYQPLALLLLSDYCAAVTAVCRSACIRVIHFLGNISSCAPHEFRLTRARKTARSVCTGSPPLIPPRLSLFLSDPSVVVGERIKWTFLGKHKCIFTSRRRYFTWEQCFIFGRSIFSRERFRKLKSRRWYFIIVSRELVIFCEFSSDARLPLDETVD